MAVMVAQFARGADHQKQIGMIMFDQHHCRHRGVNFANTAAGDSDIAATGLDLTDHETVQRLAIGALAGEQRSGFGIHAGNDANGFEHAASFRKFPTGKPLAQH
jgi:hypothetical protein